MRHFLSAAALLGFLVCAVPGANAQTNNASMDPDKKDKGGDLMGMGGLSKDRPKDAKTEITARNSATFDNATNVAEFDGSVVVKDPQFNLFCDHLKVTMSKDRKGLALVEAFGHVVIVQDTTDENGKPSKSTGWAEKAVYDPTTGDITLTGWPSVQHDINKQISLEEGTIMKLNRNGHMDTKGPSKSVLTQTATKDQ